MMLLLAPLHDVNVLPLLKHIEKVMQHKDLESQLLEAKLSQATLQLAEEKERNLQEKQQVKLNSLRG